MQEAELHEGLKAALKKHLTIDVKRGGFTDPNDRQIIVKYADTVVASAYFDVVQKPEYEG